MEKRKKQLMQMYKVGLEHEENFLFFTLKTLIEKNL